MGYGKAVKDEIEVGAADGLDIERLVVVGPQRMLPKDSEEQGADDAMDHVIDVHWSKLAAFNAAAQDGGDEPEPPSNDCLQVEPGQVWEITRLGDDKLGDDTDGGRCNVTRQVVKSRSNRVAVGPGTLRASSSRSRFGNNSPRTTALNSSSLLE